MIEGVAWQKWQQNVESFNYSARTPKGSDRESDMPVTQRGRKDDGEGSKGRRTKQDGSAADKLQVVRSLLTIAALK